MKTLKALERENDEALVKFWEAVITARKCKHQVKISNDALQQAEYELDSAQAIMEVARYNYLTEKVRRAKDGRKSNK